MNIKSKLQALGLGKVARIKGFTVRKLRLQDGFVYVILNGAGVDSAPMRPEDAAAWIANA